MAYIQPQTSIEFFTDLGLSQDYNDSLYFSSVTDKDNYFTNSNYKLAHADRCTYTRENRGFVRVELPMNTLIHAQYMRFKNTAFENKWWYAFVTDVVYINNNTTEVHFELDPLMSWMGEFTLSECFVERQHSETDEIGDNLVPEKLELGDYITETYQVSERFFNKTIMMAVAPHVEGTTYPDEGDLYGGIYSGVKFVTGSVSTINDLIEQKVRNNRGDEIIMIQMIPSDFLCEPGSTRPKEYEVSVTKPYTSVGGYTNVRNKKLFTYPYKCMSIYNCEGESIDLKYEYFSTETCNFYVRGIMSLESVIMCLPRSYMNEPLSFSNAINMRNFPKCAWTSDSYQAYIAQLNSSVPTNLLASAIPSLAGLGLSYVTGGSNLTQLAIGGAVNTFAGVSELLAAKAIPPVMPNKVHGNQTSDILYAGDLKDFYFYKKSIRGEIAKIIDDYFTMFGYEQDTVKVPNMHARQRFTYVKTQGCKINCLCPASDADFIEGLFNKGIRFWVNHEYIGDYSTANLPLV